MMRLCRSRLAATSWALSTTGGPTGSSGWDPLGRAKLKGKRREAWGKTREA